MINKKKIIEIIIAEIDWYIIERVRKLRTPKFSQAALSAEIGFSEGFIGRIENPNQSAVYNNRNLNLIVKALDVSIKDLMPDKPLRDLIKITIELGRPTKKGIGEVNYKVLRITELTEDEVKEYNTSILNRPSKSGKPTALKKRKPADRKK